MNRLRELLSQPGEEESYGDVYFVETRFDLYRVTREVARYIERRIDEQRPPAWLIFRERDGARVRIRTKDVRSLQESTARTRAVTRRLTRAYHREEKADRTWDEDNKQ